MLTVELRKTIKEGLVILAVLIILTLALVYSARKEYFAPALELFLLLYASFTGWSIFDRERQDGAMEYLLSLPVSRPALLAMKFLPRLLLAALVLVLYSGVYREFSTFFVLPFLQFALLFTTVFFLSTALSLSMKNFLGTYFIALFLPTGLFLLIKGLDWTVSPTTAAWQTALSLLVIPPLFFLFFFKFDIKPLSYFNLKFVPALIVSILAIFGINYLTGQIKWQLGFLLGDGRVLMRSDKHTVLIETQNRRIAFKDPINPLAVDGDRLYGARFSGRQNPEELIRIDSKSGRTEKLFSTEPGYWFHPSLQSGRKLADRFYFLLTSSDHKNYRILEWGPGQTRSIEVKGDFEPMLIHHIIGVIDDPLQFIVFTGTHVHRILSSGETAQLFNADAVSVWKNRLLISDRGKLTVYEVGTDIKPVFHPQGRFVVLSRKFDGLLERWVLVKKEHGYYLFDMEQQSLTQLPIKKHPYDYVCTPDGLVIVWVDGTEISAAEWKNGRMWPEKVWYSRAETEELRIIQVYSPGVVVSSKKGVEIFFFDTGRPVEDKGGAK